MTETALQKANQAVDDSMSTIILASSALATLSDTILDGKEDEAGAVRVSKSECDALTFLASHFHELVKAHVELWEKLESLRDEKGDL